MNSPQNASSIKESLESNFPLRKLLTIAHQFWSVTTQTTTLKKVKYEYAMTYEIRKNSFPIERIRYTSRIYMRLEKYHFWSRDSNLKSKFLYGEHTEATGLHKGIKHTWVQRQSCGYFETILHEYRSEDNL